MKMFRLVRDEDVTGVSGTGVVAEGIQFTDGAVVLRWVGKNPTSVVFHDNGIESIKQIHGHDGKTRIVFEEELPTLSPAAAKAFSDIVELIGEVRDLTGAIRSAKR